MFHKSQTPLKEWFLAIYLVSQSKKGISTLELQQHLGAKDDRRVAHMKQLIRQAMGSREVKYKLTGFVHAGDALFGGKSDRTEGKTGFENKVPVQVSLSIDELLDKPKYLKMTVLEDGLAKSVTQAVQGAIAPNIVNSIIFQASTSSPPHRICKSRHSLDNNFSSP